MPTMSVKKSICSVHSGRLLSQICSPFQKFSPNIQFLQNYNPRYNVSYCSEMQTWCGCVSRFEMPYNIWCEGCNKHVAMGVRYNAEKSKIGMYYTTPIYKFRMKCHLCDNHFEIKTDPAVFSQPFSHIFIFPADEIAATGLRRPSVLMVIMMMIFLHIRPHTKRGLLCGYFPSVGLHDADGGVIIIKLTAVTRELIPYRVYISGFFIFWKLAEWCHFQLIYGMTSCLYSIKICHY